MLVCSMDGTVAYLDFSLDELGDPLSEEEKVRHSDPDCMFGQCHPKKAHKKSNLN